MLLQPHGTRFDCQSPTRGTNTDDGAFGDGYFMARSPRIIGQGLVLLVSNLGSGATLLAYTFALARLLVPTDYGANVALITAFGILGLVTSGFQPTVARRVALHGAPFKPAYVVRRTVKNRVSLVALAPIAFAGILSVARPSIQSELGLASPGPVWLPVPLAVLLVVTPAMRGVIERLNFAAHAPLGSAAPTVLHVALRPLADGATETIRAEMVASLNGLAATIAYIVAGELTRP